MLRVIIVRINVIRKYVMVIVLGNIINELKIYCMKVIKWKFVYFNDFILNLVYLNIVG